MVVIRYEFTLSTYMQSRGTDISKKHCSRSLVCSIVYSSNSENFLSHRLRVDFFRNRAFKIFVVRDCHLTYGYPPSTYVIRDQIWVSKGYLNS